MIFLCILVILLGGLGYRTRGSSVFSNWPLWLFGRWRGDRVAKLLVGATPVALACLLCGLPLKLALLSLLLVAVGDTIGHASVQGAVGLGQVLGLAWRGVVSLLGPAVLLGLTDPLAGALVVLCGLTAGPAYWLGNRTPLQIRGEEPFQALEGPVVGEWFCGFARCLFVLYALT